MIWLNEEDVVTKDFNFKVEIGFFSLRHFKNAILEHNVLNGRKVGFIKNDAKRCRVVCKHKKNITT